MTISDLKTIKEYNIPIKIAIMNNESQSMVEVWEELFFDNRITATKNNNNPNFDFNSSLIYASGTINDTVPITKIYNDGKTPNDISGRLQYKDVNNKMYSYIQPMQLSETNPRTSFYLNDTFNTDEGGSYNDAYQWFAPNDMGVGGIYSTYQYTN